jgi:hypothetical protein
MPDEPFWKGVRALTAAESYADVELSPPLAPRLLPLGRAQVECHLYDDDARREAESRREASGSN